MFSAWKGEGIRSRREAHPAREVVLKVTNAEFLKGKNEMIRHLMASVDDYNKNSFFTDAPSPLDLYRLKKPKHAIQLQEHDLPYFFWEKHRVSINGSMVIVQKSYDAEKAPPPEEENHKRKTKKYLKKWFYRCADFDFSLKNGAQVDAYHWPDDDAQLYLFERDSRKFICTIGKQMVARGASAEQSTQDEKIIADFGITKAQLHQAYIDNINTIQENVKKLTGVKDLSELTEKARAKKAADEYVGNKAGITSPTPEPNLRDAHKWKTGRKPVPRDAKKKARVKTGIKDTLN